MTAGRQTPTASVPQMLHGQHALETHARLTYNAATARREAALLAAALDTAGIKDPPAQPS